MTHIEKVTELRTAWTQAILNHFRDNNMGMIKFNNMFSCLLPVENMFGDFEKVGCFIARQHRNDVTFKHACILDLSYRFPSV